MRSDLDCKWDCERRPLKLPALTLRMWFFFAPRPSASRAAESRANFSFIAPKPDPSTTAAICGGQTSAREPAAHNCDRHDQQEGYPKSAVAPSE